MQSLINRSIEISFLSLIFLLSINLNAQKNSNKQKDLISAHIERAEMQIEGLGFKKLRELIIEEGDLTPNGAFTKDNYYRQLAILSVMLEIDENSFITNAKLLDQTYDQYLQNFTIYNLIDESIDRDDKLNNSAFLFYAIDKVPTFKKCNHLELNKKRKSCFQSKINNFISKRYDAKQAIRILKDEGIVPSRNLSDQLFQTRIRFTITENGSIADVAGFSVHKDLTALGEKLVSSLPEMMPGVYEGQAVNTTYTLPIKLRVPAER